MTIWISNGAFPKSSCQWQLEEIFELNNSGRELFIFSFFLIAFD